MRKVRVAIVCGCAGLAGMLLTGTTHVASAAAVPITNASFESDAIASGSDYTIFDLNALNGGAPTGWTAFNNVQGHFVVNGSGASPRFTTFPDGTQAVELLCAPGAGGNVLYQFLSSSFLPDTQYTLSGWQGFDKNSVGAQTDGGGKLELYGSADGYAAPLVTINFPGGSSPVGGFRSGSAAFTTPASGGANGGTILVRIEAFGGPNQNFSAWDNIQLDAVAIPEPAGLGLLAASAGMMLRRRRRRGA